MYLIPCIPIFYFMGVRQVKKAARKRMPHPSFRQEAHRRLVRRLPRRIHHHGPRRGIGSTLATAVQLVSGLYADYFGLPDTQALHLGVLGMFTVITLGSIRKPLSKACACSAT